MTEPGGVGTPRTGRVAAAVHRASMDAVNAVLAGTAEPTYDELRAAVIEAAEYGLGRDGCPFCGSSAWHPVESICARVGARSYVDDIHPEQQS